MYLDTISIYSVRAIDELKWKISTEQAAGWHVILGDNGAGKSSFVRSIALALVGPVEAAALRQDWSDWLKQNRQRGFIYFSLISDSKYDRFSGRGPRAKELALAIGLERQSDGSVSLEGIHGSKSSQPVLSKVNRHIWWSSPGWFSASYGPYRRFTGGDKDYEKLFYSNPKLARHLSAFDESVALTEVIRWLQDLQFKKLEQDPEGEMLDRIVAFVNDSDFLPHGTRLAEVSSRKVSFVDGNGCDVAMEELSDGYRSVLSLTFELIRQLAITYGADNIFDAKDSTKIIVPGVVLIDEVDAHLHPTWQKRIGLWFREHFPNIQFIVTTHSPLVCQAAEHGTVFKLPTPGTSETGRMIVGEELDRLLYGNILEAYSTEAFGIGSTRSDSGEERLERLAMLNLKELDGTITQAERQEQEELRATLPTTSHVLPTGTQELILDSVA